MTRAEIAREILSVLDNANVAAKVFLYDDSTYELAMARRPMRAPLSDIVQVMLSLQSTGDIEFYNRLSPGKDAINLSYAELIDIGREPANEYVSRRSNIYARKISGPGVGADR